MKVKIRHIQRMICDSFRKRKKKLFISWYSMPGATFAVNRSRNSKKIMLENFQKYFSSHMVCFEYLAVLWKFESSELQFIEVFLLFDWDCVRAGKKKGVCYFCFCWLTVYGILLVDRFFEDLCVWVTVREDFVRPSACPD